MHIFSQVGVIKNSAAVIDHPMRSVVAFFLDPPSVCTFQWRFSRPVKTPRWVQLGPALPLTEAGETFVTLWDASQMLCEPWPQAPALWLLPALRSSPITGPLCLPARPDLPNSKWWRYCRGFSEINPAGKKLTLKCNLAEKENAHVCHSLEATFRPEIVCKVELKS